MNLKINRENLSVSEKIYDGVGEQSVELDYILPDYYPDIFKLIKCSIAPSITSYSINGDTLNYDIVADVKILYCAENDNSIHCISQRLNYSKSLNIGSGANNPTVTIQPKSDHINCRVVNKRRIDMRGAVSIKINVTGESKQEAICDIFGMNVQVKKIPIDYMAKKMTSEKMLAVSDEIEMNASKPPVSDIIRTDVKLSETSNKIIANKLVVKGDAEVKILYTGGDGVETMSFSVPYSQIVDMEGIDESFCSDVKVSPVYCDIVPAAGPEGQNTKLRYEMKLYIKCCAYKTVPISLVSDIYSTSFPCEFASAKMSVDQPPVSINERFQNKLVLETEENGISQVYDVWCTAKNINVSIDSEKNLIKVSGMLCCQAMVKNENSIPSVIEKDSAFEHEITCDKLMESSSAEIFVRGTECSYTLSDTNSISVRIDITLNGELYMSSDFDAVTDVEIDDSVKITRDGDYAIKLYYGVKDEQVWNIAKKYSTSVNAIMEENNLDSDCLTENGMLLIPIV